MGLQVWLMTSKQTEPDISSTFGWNIRFSKPIEGDLKGYSFGRVTCTFQVPPWYGAGILSCRDLLFSSFCPKKHEAPGSSNKHQTTRKKGEKMSKPSAWRENDSRAAVRVVRAMGKNTATPTRPVCVMRVLYAYCCRSTAVHTAVTIQSRESPSMNESIDPNCSVRMLCFCMYLLFPPAKIMPCHAEGGRMDKGCSRHPRATKYRGAGPAGAWGQDHDVTRAVTHTPISKSGGTFNPQKQNQT